jgi:hypothetical protein
MTDEIRPPLEESPEVADAVEDDVAVPQFITGGGTDADSPEFLQRGQGPDAGERRTRPRGAGARRSGPHRAHRPLTAGPTITAAGGLSRPSR